MDDGKTYGYPDYSNTQEDYDSGEIYAKTAFVIRNDVYEAAGKTFNEHTGRISGCFKSDQGAVPGFNPTWIQLILRRMEQVLLEINYRIFWVHRL